ncbi:hypothetical protein QBC44DRAFT_111923 [Cladorrhinum sp. PSN332]|nr:hypothetical protein QBC44DRAFT_111923 [Cladorrhinum sp. PSN332]
MANSTYQITDKYVTLSKLIDLLEEKFGSNYVLEETMDGFLYEAPFELSQAEIDSISEKKDD